MNMKLNQIATLMALSILMMASCMAEVITIEDSKGRSMMVDLLAGNDQSVKIKRLKDGKVFSMPFSSLSAKSQKEIKKKLKTLKPEYPPLEVDVVMGKRRKKENDSYYMKAMTITAKVTVTNKDRKMPCPPCHGNIIFVGESQKYKDRFLILSSQTFELVPTDRGTEFVSESFVTTYDSDNKGSGNIGGYKYEGYLLVVSDDEGRVLLTKTLFPAIKKAMATQANFVSKFSKYPVGTYLSKSMGLTKLPSNSFLR